MGMAFQFPEAIALQDNADLPQDPPPTTYIAFRPKTNLKSQQAPQCEVPSVTHCIKLQKNYLSFPGNMCGNKY